MARRDKDANDYMNAVIHQHKQQYEREKVLGNMERDLSVRENAIAQMAINLDDRQNAIFARENELNARQASIHSKEQEMAIIGIREVMVQEKELTFQQREAGANTRDQDLQDREDRIEAHKGFIINREMEAVSVLLREHQIERREKTFKRKEDMLSRAKRILHARDVRLRKQERYIAAQKAPDGITLSNMACSHSRRSSSHSTSEGRHITSIVGDIDTNTTRSSSTQPTPRAKNSSTLPTVASSLLGLRVHMMKTTGETETEQGQNLNIFRRIISAGSRSSRINISDKGSLEDRNLISALQAATRKL